MKKTYSSVLRLLKNNALKLGLILSMTGGIANAQIVSYSFSPAGATGSVGPTQAQINSAYGATNLNNAVTVNTAGIQSWTVPATGAYQLIAKGAQGGGSWGMGASMSGDYTLTAGTVLTILAGQQGSSQDGLHGSGGGGSFILNGITPMVIAGGGGGIGKLATSVQSSSHGTISTGGQSPPASGAPGGTGGGGGAAASGNAGGTATTPGQGATGTIWASGGGGFYTNGGDYDYSGGIYGSLGGRSYITNNAIGGDANNGTQCGNGPGGFGGGGGCGDRGAGGGGYSGGGAGTSNNDGGGGGGSYNSGANQNNSSGVNAGDGNIIINYVCDVFITSSATNSVNPVICSGQSITLSSAAVSNFSWSTGGTTQSIVVTPTVTTTYTLVATSAHNCSNGAVITVTVSSGQPNLTLTSSSNSICAGNSATLSASGALTYSWSNGATLDTILVSPITATTYTLYGTNGCGTTNTTVAIAVGQLPVAASTNTTIICSGSTATLTATGATTYTWNPGAIATNPFVAGPTSSTIYTVTGQTGNCISTATVALNTNPLPTISISASNSVICQGDAVTLTEGGNATSYTWSPGNQTGSSISVSPATTSLYNLEGSNSFGCTNSASQIILVKPYPNANILASTTVVCSGDPSTLSVNGAGSGTYVWFDGTTSTTTIVNPTVTTNYSVIATSTAGCSNTVSIVVNVLTPTIGIFTDASALCEGSSANLVASGADTYSWNTNSNNASIVVSPVTNTTYTVLGSVTDVDSGLSCVASNTIAISVNPSPTVTAISSKTIICRGESALLTASGAGASGTYTWTGGPAAVTTATTNVTPIANQTYSVVGADANGCKSKTTIVVTVANCTGITALTSNNDNIIVYPNPSNGEFTISGNNAITLQITDEVGQLVKTISLTDTDREVKINNLSNGIYFIKGKNENGSVMQKIIIAK